jgi:hypothetical protein
MGNLKGRNNSKDISADGRDLRETGWGGVDLIHLAQNWDQ